MLSRIHGVRYCKLFMNKTEFTVPDTIYVLKYN